MNIDNSSISIPISLLPEYLRLSAISRQSEISFPLDRIDDKLIENAYLFFLHDNFDAVKTIMNVDFDSLPARDSYGTHWPDFFPNAFPNNPDHLFSSNSLKMLKRYAVFSYLFSCDKTVIDSCCGLGWGSYLLAQRASHVYAIDNHSPSIDFAKSVFYSAENISWHLDDAIALNGLKKSNKTPVDVIVASETLEHFNKNDGIRYIESLFASIKPGGILCGTTLLFKSNDDAMSSQYYRGISSHIYAWTFNELENEFNKYSDKYMIWKNWMFFARKRS